jgi:hypothetical protein
VLFEGRVLPWLGGFYRTRTRKGIRCRDKQVIDEQKVAVRNSRKMPVDCLRKPVESVSEVPGAHTWGVRKNWGRAPLNPRFYVRRTYSSLVSSLGAVTKPLLLSIGPSFTAPSDKNTPEDTLRDLALRADTPGAYGGEDPHRE